MIESGGMFTYITPSEYIKKRKRFSEGFLRIILTKGIGIIKITRAIAKWTADVVMILALYRSFGPMVQYRMGGGPSSRKVQSTFMLSTGKRL